MKSSSMVGMVTVFCLTLATCAVAQAPAQKRLKQRADRSEQAARIFREIMDTPDQGISKALLAATECVAVFPSVMKDGFRLSGRAKHGVASCRAATGWSAPAFFNLGGGSVGQQVGKQSGDLVLLFMNKQGLDRLLADKFEIGGDTSAAAGPVGRLADASTVFDFDAHLLSYSRSRGILTGLELKGAVISPEKDGMRDVYGEGVTVKEVLKENKAAAPASVLVFPITLGRYSSRVSDLVFPGNR